MDAEAFSKANAVVGNSANAAVIELAMGGLRLRFEKPTITAITGGGAARLNGALVPMYESLKVKAGDILEAVYVPETGLRSYVAVRGGFDGEILMGSRSVCRRAGMGEPLQAGQWLNIGQDEAAECVRGPEGPKACVSPPAASRLPPRKGGFGECEKGAHVPSAAKPEGHRPRAVEPQYLAAEARGHAQKSLKKGENPTKIRLMAGPEIGWLTNESIGRLFEQPFQLSAACDRMGLRLQSEPLQLRSEQSLLSTAVTVGTVQATPNGQLIVLMYDAQTTGGYARVGQVAIVDLPLLAQLQSGDEFQFEAISAAQAEALYLQQQYF
jgi:antagonist of KipI